MTGLFRKKWKKAPINRQSHNIPIIINTLEELKLSLEHLDDPIVNELKKDAKNIVFGDGDLKSPMLILGEAPGATEDEQGKPFVGASGELLNKMLTTIEIDRHKTYVTNVINWRPAENRTPTSEEIDFFKPILHKHILLKNPKIIFVLGAIAMKALDIPGPISLQRGIVHNFQGTPVIISFHPSYLLRRQDAKRLAKNDLEFLKEYLIQINLYHQLKTTDQK